MWTFIGDSGSAQEEVLWSVVNIQQQYLLVEEMARQGIPTFGLFYNIPIGVWFARKGKRYVESYFAIKS